jgi:hypothetical protein
LLESTAPARAAPTTHQADRIDLEKQGGSAAILIGLWIENVRRSERQFDRLRPSWVLVKKESEVRGRSVRRRDGQQHRQFSVTDLWTWSMNVRSEVFSMTWMTPSRIVTTATTVMPRVRMDLDERDEFGLSA